MYLWCSRGVSSVVRRCVHRHTGQELAVKIIEITAEKMTAQQLEEVKTSTLKEIQVLNMVKGHSSISMLKVFFKDTYNSVLEFQGIKQFHVSWFPLVTLIDSYESTTFIFLVFDLWVRENIARNIIVILLPITKSLSSITHLFCFPAWGEESCLTTSRKRLLWVRRKPGTLWHQHTTNWICPFFVFILKFWWGHNTAHAPIVYHFL